jgi:hypothetical protein
VGHSDAFGGLEVQSNRFETGVRSKESETVLLVKPERLVIEQVTQGRDHGMNFGAAKPAVGQLFGRLIEGGAKAKRVLFRSIRLGLGGDIDGNDRVVILGKKCPNALASQMHEVDASFNPASRFYSPFVVSISFVFPAMARSIQFEGMIG